MSPGQSGSPIWFIVMVSMVANVVVPRQLSSLSLSLGLGLGRSLSLRLGALHHVANRHLLGQQDSCG